MLKTVDFDYNLPKELIAQEPIKPRDKSRLLLVNKQKKVITHSQFDNLVDYLNKGDLLVVNNSKVFPARIIARKETGSKLEFFLLKKIDKNIWQCLIKGKTKNLKKIKLSNKLIGEIIEKNQDNTYLISFNLDNKKLAVELGKISQVPLPPYIKKGLADKSDKNNYQTVYADLKQAKSVAAPTAGLHFTKKLLAKLEKKGVIIAKITLHVGLGTFSPVKTEKIIDHKMHQETVIINKDELKKILRAKKEKKRIIAVGTTVCRSLESLALNLNKIKKNQDWQIETNIFIYPGFKFKMTDALITNFHLPKSTLLMLVSALAEKNLIKEAYQIAIEKKYRFFSYGDAMLIY